MRSLPALFSAGCCALLLGGCAAAAEDEITVFAAASLHEVFEEIGELYTEETGTKVRFNFAGSSGLVEQLENGAPADVLATADEETMRGAAAEGLVSGEAEVFAENYLVIVTPAGNPSNVASIESLEDNAVETVICAAQVPCGAATARAAEAFGVQITPVSEETSVTDVLGRVRSGEADAGLVYNTDARQGVGEVETIEIEGAEMDPNRYPLTLLERADSPEAGQEFVDFVLNNQQARRVLAGAGFTEPQGSAMTWESVD
ncbi:molybdate ABC transporter substrate-binding protein [Nesterenkonia alkaliphila]|uniref:Molybdate ABC transporter substrate-binding protein n=1 Tax=Nesterenkonia alkaliphila TaxID=1463631 RepID=A0A7K1UKL6_9MICC|nr:molybdate ABC transporter substrate-binding protein [Nesterenkonia alkaliphila]MVT26966.1 molybdate ABC transporter substrate-binding protein [Nesterenkonia alkaliphila]GFZ90294.1 molybdate-binding protein [Nesterenkonia alkaliphila]